MILLKQALKQNRFNSDTQEEKHRQREPGGQPYRRNKSMQYHFWPQECCNAILYQAASPNLSSQTMCLILLHSTTGASSVNQKSITDLVSHVIIKNVPRSLSTSVCCKHLCTSLFSTKRITIPVFKSVGGGVASPNTL